MGTVFRARDLQQDTLCAIKMLHKRALQDEADFQRFTNEATIIAQLFHPNIVEVREFRRDAQCGPFLVMELLRGIELHSHLADGRRLPLDRVQLVVRQVASALHAAHSLGIVHRDIKPRNIFLAQQCGTTGAMVETVKVVDFGLSKILGGRAQTAPGEILGTPEYLAPEGTWGRSALIDERTDQWALAVTAYRMLTGKLPFCDEDVLRLMLKVRQQPLPLLSAHAVQVPEYVAQALSRALSKKKEDRYPSVLDFARALYGLTAPTPPPRTEVVRVPESVGALHPRVPPLTPEPERQIEQLENPGAKSGAETEVQNTGDERLQRQSSKWRLVVTGSIFGALLTLSFSVGFALVRDHLFPMPPARFPAGSQVPSAAEPGAAFPAPPPPPGLGNRLTSSQAVRP